MVSSLGSLLIQCLHVYLNSGYDLNLLIQQQSKLNDQYSLASQQQKLADSYSQEQSAAYLSRYTQEATEVIKNAVGVSGDHYLTLLFSTPRQNFKIFAFL